MFSTDKPTVDDFLQAYKRGVVGRKDRLADVREGSIFEIIGGTAAILWSREAQRDQDLFDDTTTDTADGTALTDRVFALTGISRILDTAGTGTARLERPTTAAGDGTFWEGTRIILADRAGLTDIVALEVAADTLVDATVSIVDIPIRSVTTGNDAITASSSSSVYPRFDDIVWDSTWVIRSLTCDAGTKFEPAGVYKARVRDELLDRRLGFPTSIVAACKAAGASKVVLFDANYGGDANDFGLNMVYVADASYVTTSALIAATYIALDKVRILGDNMQVRPMQTVTLTVHANVYLNDKPTNFNQPALIERLQNSVAGALEQDFSYSLDRFRGAMFKTSSVVQDCDFVSPVSDGNVLVPFGSIQAFPATLTRYTLRPQDVIIKLLGPR